MKVCDRCREPVKSRTEITFEKEDNSKKSRKRRMLNIKMELCESCITELLRAFGTFKVNFMKPKETKETNEKPLRSNRTNKERNSLV